MQHNEDDIAAAKDKAKELNMELYFKLTWDAEYKPKKVEMLQAETGMKFLPEQTLL
jgi:hypothetical protein